MRDKYVGGYQIYAAENGYSQGAEKPTSDEEPGSYFCFHNDDDDDDFIEVVAPPINRLSGTRGFHFMFVFWHYFTFRMWWVSHKEPSWIILSFHTRCFVFVGSPPYVREVDYYLDGLCTQNL